MSKVLMIGSDVHDKTILAKYSIGSGAIEERTFRNNRAGRKVMWKFFVGVAKKNDADRMVFAYEASGVGYGLHDEGQAEGLECYVLAPSKIERSSSQRKNKCDAKDAEQILRLVRGFVLAGNNLPTVWIPDDETRDCREVTRCRLDLTEKATKVKTQIQTLLKRYGQPRPPSIKKSWTKKHRTWLDEQVVEATSNLQYGTRIYMASLIRQLSAIEKDIVLLDKEVLLLSKLPRYKAQADALVEIKGVSTLVAMVFLTELGDCQRFSNRKQIGAYLGLVPSSFETGLGSDRKGHITREGPARIRKILCQAVWSRVRCDLNEKLYYNKIKERNPKKTKIAVVASMRRLGILLWHRSMDALNASA